MKMTKKKIYAIALTGALAISAISVGFAEWKTDITAESGVSAKGKWEVVVTDADINVSTGTALSIDKTYDSLTRTGVASDDSIAPSLCAGDWVDDEALLGTQSEEKMSATTHYYAVDTSKFDVSDVAKLDRNAVMTDETTVVISNEFNRYYRNSKSADQSTWNTPVVDGLLRDLTALLKERYPDNYTDYALVRMVGLTTPGWGNYDCVASFRQTVTPTEAEEAIIDETATSVSYADVAFAMPGAWAEYKLTVTNNGTVDAKLSDIIIELDSESDQLVLEKPELTDEVLKAGESCTITFNLYVPEKVTEDLNAAGRLTVKLPYAQTEIEARPTPGHTHN